MIKRVLPLYKTGWFYLLLILWLSSFWLWSEGGFNRLNQFNLFLVHQTNNLQVNEHSVLRVDVPFNINNLPKIQQLLTRYSDLPIVMLGDPDEVFIKRISTFLQGASQGSFQRDTRKSKIIIVNDNANYAGDIATVDQSMFSHVLAWFRANSLKNSRDKETPYFVYSSFSVDQNNKMPVVKRVKHLSYLTVLGEILRQVEFNQQPEKKYLVLNQGWELELATKKKQWPLGFSGNIIVSGFAPEASSIETLLNNPRAKAIKLLLINGDKLMPAEQISLAAERLLNNKYLTQSVLVNITQWFVLFLGLALIWLIKAFIPVRQAQIIVVYCALLFVLQYLFLSNHLWFEALPILVIIALSWLIFLAYREENQLFVSSHLQYNALLVETLLDLSRHQSSEKIHLWLAQATPDKNLVKKVAELAKRAKEENNNKLSQILFAWHKKTSDTKTSSFEKVTHQQASKTLVLSKEKAQTLFENLGENLNDNLGKKVAKNSNTTTETAKISTLDNSHQIIEDDELEQTMVISAEQKPPSISPTSTLKVSKFGRYKVEGVLGKGAMGIVYQGVDPKINRHVAIKTLQISDNIDFEDADEAKQRFFKEAETAGRLSHANIVTIYDVGEEKMLGYIAMDLLTGAPLSHFIKPENLLPTPLVYQLMIQITDALEYAHRQNVVHRDIKPGNIIYDDDLQRVTVTDFGIAYVSDNSKTRTGVIMGSPYYMSPEQILGKKVDGRSDIFSLGATLYQLLCGYLPFEGDSVMSVVYQISNEKHISVTKCNDKLPPSAARITNKALHKDIDKRYQSMQEFKLALISALKRDFKKAPII